MKRSVLIFFVNLSFAVAGLAATSPKNLEKKFAFPPPVQWRVGRWEVSVVGLAWGPANSPEMISRGHIERATNKPAFFPDRPYALAIQLRGFSPNTNSNSMYGGSGLVLIKDVSGDFQVPLVLSPSGFTRFSGSPGTMDLAFDHSNKTNVWDFFPVAAHQKAFLFQSFAFSPMRSGRGRPKVSFRVLIRNNELELVNLMPGSQNSCTDFTRNFSGTIGSDAASTFHLSLKGTKLSGTEQYTKVGKNLWLSGRVDSFGNLVLNEQYPKNHLTGVFKGTFSSGCQSMSGYFSKPDGSRLLPFDFQQSTTPAK